MKSFSIHPSNSRSGAALIIALGFIVLLTGLIIAFLSQSQTERAVSTASASSSTTDMLARGAVDTILGDLKQEIADGSAVTSANGTTLYTPTAPANAAPALAGSTGAGGLENLVKRSAYSVSTHTNGPARAANAPTTTPSSNGRVITRARWNKHFLLAKQSPNDAMDSTPVTPFTAPDWIMVARDGSNPTTWNQNLTTQGSNPVLGRFAYAIYNEGGLLDVNVAGHPSTSSVPQKSYKNTLSYADLTQAGLTVRQVDALVGWRNHASTQAPGSALLAPGFTAASAGLFHQYVSSNSRGFMEIGSTALHAATGQSDQRFSSRQQLIQFLTQGLAADNAERAALQNSLRYLGTFSRVLNQPSFRPDPDRPKVIGDMYAGPPSTTYNGGNSAYGLDNIVNPAFRLIRVANKFDRNDGSRARVGEPLVKKRFALNRLAWITYRGPSASLDQANDPVLQQYLAHGIPASLLSQGTPENIRKYFGLTWTAGPGAGGLGGYWTYDHGLPNTVGTLEAVRDANREPDFFELLKAGIHVGAIARASTGIHANLDTLTVQDVAKEASRVDNHILQIGANILDQFGPENFPTRIVFDDGTRRRAFFGKVDLPYWYGYTTIGVLVRRAAPATADGLPVVPAQDLSDPGLGAALLTPFIWNPHTASSPGVAPGLTPSQLRICVSNFSLPAAETMTTSPGSFWLRTFPKYRYGYTNPVNNSNETKNISQNLVLSPWLLGTRDDPGGVLTMPAEGTNGNTALYFNHTPSLYREPTPLLRPGFPAGSHLQTDGGNAMGLSSPLTAGRAAGDASWADGIPEHGTGQRYLGFYLGKFPQRWNAAPAIGTVPDGTPGQVTYTVNALGHQPSLGFTVSMEFKSGDVWIPYHQFTWGVSILNGENGIALDYDPGSASPYKKSVMDNWSTTASVDSQIPGQAKFERVAAFAWDPRSHRWSQNGTMSLGAFLDEDKSMTASFRPDGGVGVNTHGFLPGGAGKDMWLLRAESTGNGYRTDADGTIRRAMGAYVPASGSVTGGASTPVGLPMATAHGMPANASNRPLILHRPFRSVAELGYVFSDAPWKNIDFFTPESGFSALLDVFCIQPDDREDAFAAGKVDLNTRQQPVLQALLAGAYRDELGTSGPLTAAETEALAAALIAHTTSTADGKGPLANLAELVGRYGATFNNGVTPTGGSNRYDGFSKDLASHYEGTATSPNKLVQRFREASIRAFTSAGQAGTWNFMIDVIAQNGRYPLSASGFDAFLVEGERRYWVHVAIDRQSNQIIDQQIEVVNE